MKYFPSKIVKAHNIGLDHDVLREARARPGGHSTWAASHSPCQQGRSLTGTQHQPVLYSNKLIKAEVHTTLFKQYLAQEDYREALRSLLENPVKSYQDACMRQLISALLEKRQTQVLISLPYRHLKDQVAGILESQCKNTVVTSDPGMYGVAYAFHMNLFEYNKGFFARSIWPLTTSSLQPLRRCTSTCGGLGVSCRPETRSRSGVASSQLLFRLFALCWTTKLSSNLPSL